ncbi:MAG: glycosyltransferase family 2 protein, partial [Nitrososphaerales archaeon]
MSPKTPDSVKPGISIALCTYNGAQYLSSQLESYLAQTYLPDELIVCDDCSQDETVAILNGFAARAPFSVRILVNDRNLGSTKNFEKAISLCSGGIIFLSDQDDVWAPYKIERVFNAFGSNSEIGMVFSDAELVDETLQPLGRNLLDGRITREERELIEKGNLFAILFKRNIVTGATLAFRAGYSNAIIPISTDIPKMFHDEWIAVILSIIAKNIFLDEPLIKYRQHNKQQIGMDFANYVTIMSKLAWKNVMEKVERKHEAKKEYMEMRKYHLTSHIDMP